MIVYTHIDIKLQKTHKILIKYKSGYNEEFHLFGHLGNSELVMQPTN